MAERALADAVIPDADHADRINVLDDSGSLIGWVDPNTGQRILLVPGRRADFNETVNFWLTAAGLSGEPIDETTEHAATDQLPMKVVEVRYPDPDIVRSLLVPLLPLA